MKAVLGALPAESDDHLWAYEVKWDGYRTVLHVRDGALRVQSSSGVDVTARYPELAALTAAVNATSTVLDGELVVLDDDGRPRFELMQRHATEVAFYAFDVLEVNGRDTIGLPYEQRRSLLGDVLEPGRNWAVPAYRVGDGAAFLAATAAHGLEGIMAKRLGSHYVPGQRSHNWRKVKNRIRDRLVIGGWTAGTGTRAGTFGALLVGRYGVDGRLQFAGGVGTGFTEARLVELHAALVARRRDDCPFDPPPPRTVTRTATWVHPDLVAEVEFAEWTNDGLVRQAAFIDLVDGVVR
jgi:bifunctional non-homologous end joining protein LigD